jgi:hypothetical protein
MARTEQPCHGRRPEKGQSLTYATKGYAKVKVTARKVGFQTT